jgi:hypothetical protein
LLKDVAKVVLEFLCAVEQFRVFFVIKHLFIKILILLHLESLKLLYDGPSTNSRDGFSDLLLNADRHVFVNEVLHGHEFVFISIHFIVKFFKHFLDFKTLLIEILLVLLSLLHIAHILS